MALAGFVANFTFEPRAGGVLVSHTEDQRFRDTPLGRLAERVSGPWLRRHLETEEMPRLKALMESATA